MVSTPVSYGVCDLLVKRGLGVAEDVCGGDEWMGCVCVWVGG